MKLTPDQVRKIAKLARLKLSEDEVLLFSEQLSDVLDYMKILNEVDTEKVAPMFQSTGLKNRTREDIADQNLADQEALLECSNLPLVKKQIKVPKVM